MKLGGACFFIVTITPSTSYIFKNIFQEKGPWTADVLGPPLR
jgi:hypothetical protein